MRSATTSWRQRVRDAANRVGLPRFWRWWVGELAPLLPAPWRAKIQRRFARPVIELTDGEAVFWRAEAGNGSARLVITEKISLAGDPAAVLAAGRAAVARLAANASAGIAAPKVVIALGARQILRKELALPAAVEENLAQALAYDLDRHTPFRPEQVYFDAAVIGRDPVRKMLRVDWVAALKTAVDDAYRQIEDWGAVPVAVVPGPPTGPATRLNLLPNAARPRPLQWRRWQVWAPLALVALFVIAAVLVPLVQKREYVIALNLQTAEAAQRAQAADALRQQLEGMQNDYNYVLARKYAYPSTVQVLDDISRILPDDTWLTQFDVKSSSRGKETQRDVYLRGESANAGKLISMLEESKLVEQAAPRSPTSKVQGAPGEVFDLGARLKALPLPAAQPVSAVAPPPVAQAPPRAAPASAPGPASAATPAPPARAVAPPASPEAETVARPRLRGPRAEMPAAPAPANPAAAPPEAAPAPEDEPEARPEPKS
jgi:general secretion pathway protein L